MIEKIMSIVLTLLVVVLGLAIWSLVETNNAHERRHDHLRTSADINQELLLKCQASKSNKDVPILGICHEIDDTNYICYYLGDKYFE